MNAFSSFFFFYLTSSTTYELHMQLEAFRAGFNQVFEASSLQIFSPSELDYLLCGRREMWEADTLVERIKFDHGYTSKSPVVINLLEIMGEFNPEQQRAFCQFVTGAPRLPPGGLVVLNPTLTIVRKLQSSNNTASNAAGGVAESADDDLTSVMTCANYLKLPPYSTKFYLVSDIAVKELIVVATNREEHFMLKLQETEKSKHHLWFNSDSGTKRVLVSEGLQKVLVLVMKAWFRFKKCCRANKWFFRGY
ncbi:hypothetical protein Lser_V15G03843 [Lactuca serriola]